MPKRRKSENPSQRDWRRYINFRDQHGREWGGTVEEETLHPIGELEPRFSAPIYPPQKYFRYAEKDVGRLRIDYDAWLADEDVRRAEHQETMQAYAIGMYQDRAADVLEHPTPALLGLVGQGPAPRERILALMAGNKWALGLLTPEGKPYPRPSWADKYFPAPAPTPKPEDLFPDVDLDAFGDEDEEDEGEGDVVHPRFVRPGLWELSDGSRFAGKKLDAIAAEEALLAEV